MTESARWFVDVTDKIFTGIGAHTNDAIGKFLEGIEGLEDRDINFIQVAYGFAPKPVNMNEFIKLSPYGNPQVLEQQFEEAAGRGWLQAPREGQYGLTPKGAEVAQSLFNFADKLFGDLTPLPDADLSRIANLLLKITENARSLPKPEEKQALTWGDMFDRGPSAPLMVTVRRRLLDLLGFRDDAHVAAWSAYENNGQIWETLTYVWREEGRTAVELAEKLAYRDYDEEAYDAALLSLADRGWLAPDGDGYSVTDKGKKVRQDAEDATDALFDAAWTVLDKAETEELKTLLRNMAKAVEPAEEEPG